MDREAQRVRLRTFLEAIRRPDAKGDQWQDDDPLVTSGLIDSLAVLEIISYLESEAGIDFSATGVEPEHLRSVNAILDLIERRGAR